MLKNDIHAFSDTLSNFQNKIVKIMNNKIKKRKKNMMTTLDRLLQNSNTNSCSQMQLSATQYATYFFTK